MKHALRLFLDDQDLFNYYKKLVRIRKESVALRRGSFTPLLTDDATGIYVFRRRSGDDEAIAALNNGGKEQRVDIKVDGSWK